MQLTSLASPSSSRTILKYGCTRRYTLSLLPFEAEFFFPLKLRPPTSAFLNPSHGRDGVKLTIHPTVHHRLGTTTANTVTPQPPDMPLAPPLIGTTDLSPHVLIVRGLRAPHFLSEMAHITVALAYPDGRDGSAHRSNYGLCCSWETLAGVEAKGGVRRGGGAGELPIDYRSAGQRLKLSKTHYLSSFPAAHTQRTQCSAGAGPTKLCGHVGDTWAVSILMSVGWQELGDRDGHHVAQEVGREVQVKKDHVGHLARNIRLISGITHRHTTASSPQRTIFVDDTAAGLAARSNLGGTFFSEIIHTKTIHRLVRRMLCGGALSLGSCVATISSLILHIVGSHSRGMKRGALLLGLVEVMQASVIPHPTT
ncbi:hypothetical protein BJV74DRAFT_911365 [Russula compacta]|nr:hypothetical protein BJV74DRAFT_911365 [Russula compacta]